MSSTQRSPRGLRAVYQVGWPVVESTEPTAATGPPQMALISEDFPAPRRPTIISFGGRDSISISLSAWTDSITDPR